jgi:hypothetical protein
VGRVGAVGDETAVRDSWATAFFAQYGASIEAARLVAVSNGEPTHYRLCRLPALEMKASTILRRRNRVTVDDAVVGVVAVTAQGDPPAAEVKVRVALSGVDIWRLKCRHHDLVLMRGRVNAFLNRCLRTVGRRALGAESRPEVVSAVPIDVISIRVQRRRPAQRGRQRSQNHRHNMDSLPHAHDCPPA